MEEQVIHKMKTREELMKNFNKFGMGYDNNFIFGLIIGFVTTVMCVFISLAIFFLIASS